MNKKYTVETLTVGRLQANCYILSDNATGEALIIDPGDEGERIVKIVEKHSLKPVGIINTHGHYDHIGANSYLKDLYRVPLYIHELDKDLLSDARKNGSLIYQMPLVSPQPDVLLHDGSVITAGSLQCKVIHTPGHTKGGICISVENLLFTGDTLFCGTIGRTDLPGGSDQEITSSLKKLSVFPPETVVLPGHDQSSTIKDEKETNPYF
jgi:glyoxylase-like metal-dependent hydrolase (beta-lactamase superfamily II)